MPAILKSKTAFVYGMALTWNRQISVNDFHGQIEGFREQLELKGDLSEPIDQNGAHSGSYRRISQEILKYVME